LGNSGDYRKQAEQGNFRHNSKPPTRFVCEKPIIPHFWAAADLASSYMLLQRS